MGQGELTTLPEELWAWASNRANANQVRVVHNWGATTVASRRAIVLPVWETSPSGENPKPTNEFNGAIALVIDINRFVEVYLGRSHALLQRAS